MRPAIRTTAARGGIFSPPITSAAQEQAEGCRDGRHVYARVDVACFPGSSVSPCCCAPLYLLYGLPLTTLSAGRQRYRGRRCRFYAFCRFRTAAYAWLAYGLHVWGLTARAVVCDAAVGRGRRCFATCAWPTTTSLYTAPSPYCLPLAYPCCLPSCCLFLRRRAAPLPFSALPFALPFALPRACRAMLLQTSSPCRRRCCCSCRLALRPYYAFKSRARISHPPWLNAGAPEPNACLEDAAGGDILCRRWALYWYTGCLLWLAAGRPLRLYHSGDISPLLVSPRFRCWTLLAAERFAAAKKRAASATAPSCFLNTGMVGRRLCGLAVRAFATGGMQLLAGRGRLLPATLSLRVRSLDMLVWIPSSLHPQTSQPSAGAAFLAYSPPPHAAAPTATARWFTYAAVSSQALRRNEGDRAPGVASPAPTICIYLFWRAAGGMRRTPLNAGGWERALLLTAARVRRTTSRAWFIKLCRRRSPSTYGGTCDLLCLPAVLTAGGASLQHAC